jgi:excisionase family DNA binding protein
VHLGLSEPPEVRARINAANNLGRSAPDGDWLTYSEAAERLGVSAEAVRQMAIRGHLRRTKGDGKALVLLPDGWSPPVRNARKTLQTRLRMAASKRGVPRPQWVREKISRGRLAYYAAKRAVAETAGG